MIVLDASAALELLLATELGAVVATRIADSNETIHAPHLLDLEVTQVLRRFARAGSVSPARAEEALDDLQALDVARYPHDVLIPRVWELRGNLTAYDGAYVALAEALRCPIVTTDARLAAAPGNRATIELVAQ